MKKKLTGGALVATAILVAACEQGALTEPAAPLGPVESSLSFYGVGSAMGATPRPCTAEGHDRFDFWVGDWDVYNPAGTRVATSVISKELDGCVVMEDYIAGQYRGLSLNMYDVRTGGWTQFYVDNIITNYRLAGGLDGNRMVMTSAQPAFDLRTGIGAFREDSIVWTPNGDGSVQQTFYTSWNGGPTNVGFNGRYVPSDDLERDTPGQGSYCRFFDEFRGVEFWVGDWDVEAVEGPRVGSSTVTSEQNSCLIVESFDNGRGYQSRSFLHMDLISNTWYRVLADTRGRYVMLSGTRQPDGRIVLTGTDEAPSGREILVRNTLEETAAGVLQTWEISRDGGESWKDDMRLSYTAG